MRALIDELSLVVEEVGVDVHITRCIVTSVVDGSQYADSTPGVLDGTRVRDSKLIRLTARLPGTSRSEGHSASSCRCEVSRTTDNRECQDSSSAEGKPNTVDKPNPQSSKKGDHVRSSLSGLTWRLPARDCGQKTKARCFTRARVHRQVMRLYRLHDCERLGCASFARAITAVPKRSSGCARQ